MAGDFPVRLDVGGYLDITLLSADQVASFDTGFGEPAGPAVRLHIVGIGRMPLWNDGFHVVASPAFAAGYRTYRAGRMVLLRLSPADPAHRAFAAGLDQLAAANPPPPELAEFGPLRAIYRAAEEEPLVAPPRRILVGALTISAGLAGLAALVVIAQALSRHHATGTDSQRVEAALGLTRAERAGARTLAAVAAGALSGVFGTGLGLAAGAVEPLGAMRRFEPTPGYRPDVVAAVVGGTSLVLLFLLLAAATAALVLRPRLPAPVASINTSRVTTIGWSAALHAGWCLSRSGRFRAAGGLSAAVGLAVTVAALTFAVSLDRLVATPARYGWNVDLTVDDAKDDEIARLVADRRVEALTVTSYSEIPVAGEPVRVYTFEPRKGQAGPTVLAGRLPARPDEVALGPRLAARLDLVPGDDVTLNRPDGQPVHRRVVGIAVVRHIGTEFRQGNDIVVPPGALPELAPTVFGRQADIRAIAGQATALATDVGNRVEIATAEPPPEVTTLAEIRLLPYTLALVAGAGALAGLLHALYSARLRTRREYAILRALGFTRRQLGTARVVTALAFAVPAALVGVPVGLGTGRLAWYEIALSAGVGGDALIPTGWLVAVCAAVLLIAGLAGVAARPGRAGLPGRALRVE
jgi:hypothetical protein